MKIPVGKRSNRLTLFITVFVLLFVCCFMPAGLKAETPKAFTEPAPRQLKAILSGFEAYAQGAMKDWQVPGMAVAIGKGGKGDSEFPWTTRPFEIGEDMDSQVNSCSWKSRRVQLSPFL